MAFDWKSVIGKFAPTIATALGSPLAGAAASAVSQVLLGKTDATSVEINEALANATPEQIAEIKKADQDFEVKMKTLDIDLEKLRYDDIGNAREREVQVKDNTPKILAAFAVACFMGIIVCVMVGFSPKDAMRDGFWMLVGAAIATYKDVYGYYFGSSSGSGKKDETISNLSR